jgi:hypothetical protein
MIHFIIRFGPILMEVLVRAKTFFSSLFASQGCRPIKLLLGRAVELPSSTKA